VSSWPATARADAVVGPSEDETRFLELINQARAEAALPPLVMSAELVPDARRHTAAMIGAGSVFHSTPGALASYAAGWELLGENVGLGSDVTVIHRVFLDSDSHRDNVLGDFDRVGIGADRAPDGTMFVTVVFMRTGTETPPSTEPRFQPAPDVPDVVRDLERTETPPPPARELCSAGGAPGVACID
jgi:hypothetical protein